MAHRAPAGVPHRRLALVAHGAVGNALALGLRQRGCAVAVVDPDPPYDAALRRAVAAVGRLDAVVWAATPDALARPAPLADTSRECWEELVGGTLRGYVEWLQATHRLLAGGAARVVVVVPTIAMSGAAGLVGWATVADGQRALAKSVARVWGADGITVNCVAVPAGLLAGTGADLDRPALQRSALDEPMLAHEVAEVVTALAGDDLAGVTGATIGVDGGGWMPA